MKQFVLKVVTLSMLAFGLIAPFVVTDSVMALSSGSSQVCNAIGSGTNCQSSGPDVSTVMKTVLNLLSIIVGAVAVIMVIVSGLKYVTSGGDANSVSSAKSTLVYAIVGLVIVAFAQIIVQFVLHKVNAPSCPTGQVLVDKTNRCVPAP